MQARSIRRGLSSSSLSAEPQGAAQLTLTLLQHFRRRLRDLRFEELCQIAEWAQKHPAPTRRVRSGWRKYG
jgi:hypothetical protein